MPHSDELHENIQAVRANPRKLPVWAMGLANAPLGFVFGFISTAMGILLAARHVSPVRVTEISGIAFSPSFWAWTLSPIVDVRFSKRFYGYGFAALAAVLLGAAVLALGNLAWFTGLITASCAAAVIYGNALTGWAPDAVDDAEYDTMSGWLNVANLGAAGVFSAVSVVCVRFLPLPVAAACLALLVFAPAALLRFFPTPQQPEGSLQENFAHMTRDLRRVLREGRVWIGLVIFLAPLCSFALTNIFSTLGENFGVSERAVTTLNGPGVAIVCSMGCLLAIPLCRMFRRRSVYVMAGLAGATVAAIMGILPHSLAVYAVGLLAYNFFQGFNYTSFTAFAMEIVGPRNALAGTMMAILTASSNVPISMMTVIDGRGYHAGGVRGMFFMDAGVTVATSAVIMLLVVPRLDRWVRRNDTSLEVVS